MLSLKARNMITQLPLDVPPGFDELSKEEQIEYLQALWNRIATDEAELPVPEWHLQIVRDRLATFAPEESVLWSSVRDRLKRRNDDG